LSLRARLLIALIGLVAGGLIVVAVVTYEEERSFLLGRVDQQAVGALEVVSFQLDLAGANVAAPTGTPEKTPGPGGWRARGAPRAPPGSMSRCRPAPMGNAVA
jgi:two-component system OmpR family sensor kinase